MAKDRKLIPTPYQYEQLTLANQISLSYKDVAIKLFHWENIPESVTSDIIEEFLYDNGCCVCFNDDTLGVLFLPPTTFTNMNVYGIPQLYSARGYNGTLFNNLTPDNSVMIKNSPKSIPTRLYVDTKVDELTNVIMARTTNVNATKTPFVIEGDENETLSMRNLYEQITGNKMVIYKNKTKAQTSIGLNVLETGAPYLADKLTQLKNAIECDILTYLGLNNNNVEKAERLVTGEVEANNEIIVNYLYMRYKERVDACNKINAMLGTNIEVRINKDFINEFNKSIDENVNDIIDESEETIDE